MTPRPTDGGPAARRAVLGPIAAMGRLVMARRDRDPEKAERAQEELRAMGYLVVCIEPPDRLAPYPPEADDEPRA